MENETWEAPVPDTRKKITAGKILWVLLSCLIGALFVFSAISKAWSVPYFEYIISSQVQVSHELAAWAARFFIGFEGALGLLLFINILGYRRWVIKACLALLLIFCIHLLYLLFSQGNDVDCGCMGNLVPMTPGLSLLKNAGLVTGLLILLRWYKPNESRVLHIAAIPVTLIFTAIPFFLFPVQKQLSLPLTKLYTTQQSEHPKEELRKGKHVLCFMSLSCEHCRHAAAMIAKMKRSNPSLPFYFALSGGTDSTRAIRFASFMNETQARNIPYHFLEKDDFINMVMLTGSKGVPVILWMQDTTIIRRMDGSELDQKEIETWLTH
jgi:hypothetical protein